MGGGGGRVGREVSLFFSLSYYAEQREEFSGCQHEFSTKVWFKMYVQVTPAQGNLCRYLFFVCFKKSS